MKWQNTPRHPSRKPSNEMARSNTDEELRAPYFFGHLDERFRRLFGANEPVWEAVKRISRVVEQQNTGDVRGTIESGANVQGKVTLGEGSVIECGASIKGPVVIGRNVQVRHGAYVRENTLVGDTCLIGHCTELKNCVLMDNCRISHFNFVGDSILGERVHLAAGVIVASLKLIAGTVVVHFGGRSLDTRMVKFGTAVGDDSEVGCNSVINPGVLVGRRCVIYPNTTLAHFCATRSIVKPRGNLRS